MDKLRNTLSLAKQKVTTLVRGRQGETAEDREARRLLNRRIQAIDQTQFWLHVTFEELMTWSLKELRIACAARGLSQDGKRLDMIHRLMAKAQKERKELEFQSIVAELKEQRESEAQGTVYVVGRGYGADMSSWDRLFVRNNLTVLQALSGRGVVQLSAGSDSTLAYALCGNGDVWSWGFARRDEPAPIGYDRTLVFMGEQDTFTYKTVPHVEVGKPLTALMGIKPAPARRPLKVEDWADQQLTDFEEQKRNDEERRARQKVRRDRLQEVLDNGFYSGLKELVEAEGMPPLKQNTQQRRRRARPLAASATKRFADDDQTRVQRLRAKGQMMAKSEKEHEWVTADSIAQQERETDEKRLRAKYGRALAKKYIATGRRPSLGNVSSSDEEADTAGTSRSGGGSGTSRRGNGSKAGGSAAADDSHLPLRLRKGAVTMEQVSMNVDQEEWWSEKARRRRLNQPDKHEGWVAPPKVSSNALSDYGSYARYGDPLPLEGHVTLGDDPSKLAREEIEREQLRGGEFWFQNKDIRLATVQDMEDATFLPPLPISRMKGQASVQLAAGHGHALATTAGGDIFSWGLAENGALGHGEMDQPFVNIPTLVRTFMEAKKIVQVDAGHAHSAALASDGELLMWGASGDGRLGMGALRSFGPHRKEFNEHGQGKPLGRSTYHKDSMRQSKQLNVTVPTPVTFFSTNRHIVRQVSCGALHTLALTEVGAFSWGSGDGGRLGHGNRKHRDIPTLIEGLKGMVVVQVSAGTWHSAALVQVPPLVMGGWVYSWGTGLQGQLGHGADETVCLAPRMIDQMMDDNLVFTHLQCGVYHNAAITNDGDVYTWGRNLDNALGRPGSMALQGYPAYDSRLGRIEGLREYGVGRVVSIAVGMDTTYVATAPYRPPPAYRLRELALLDLAREQQSLALYDKHMEVSRKQNRKVHMRKERQRIILLNKTQPLCTLTTACTGFVPQLFRPMTCEVCGYDKKYHTRLRVVPPIVHSDSDDEN